MKHYPVQDDQNVTSHHSQRIHKTLKLYPHILKAAIMPHLFCAKILCSHILYSFGGALNYMKCVFPLLAKNYFM